MALATCPSQRRAGTCYAVTAPSPHTWDGAAEALNFQTTSHVVTDMSVTDNQTSLRSGIFPAISVNKDATVIRVTALQCEPVSPKVTKEREEYLLSSSHQTTATPLASPKERKLRM